MWACMHVQKCFFTVVFIIIVDSVEFYLSSALLEKSEGNNGHYACVPGNGSLQTPTLSRMTLLKLMDASHVHL